MRSTTQNLTLIKKLENHKNLYRCYCGNKIVAPKYQVKYNTRTHCGCDTLKNRSSNNLRHGLYGKRVYNIWNNLKQRCHNKNDHCYKYYGAKGITVCKRWKSFENFLMDMGEPPSPGHSLDRINNKKGYSKNNCRWATRKEQALNTSRTIFYTLHGRTKSLKEWAEDYSTDYHRVWSRINNLGWSLEKALITPPRPMKPYKRL